MQRKRNYRVGCDPDALWKWKCKEICKKTSSAKTKTETETKTPEEIEAEKVQEVLDSDQYKDQLGELYKKNPETKGNHSEQRKVFR